MLDLRQLIHAKWHWSQWVIAAVALVVFIFGIVWRSPSLLGGGAVVLCLGLRQVGDSDLKHNSESPAWSSASPRPYETVSATPSSDYLIPSSPPRSTDAFVEELLASRRYALLLRPETKQHLTQQQIVRAVRQLDESMALVPAGRVLLGQLAEQSHAACGPMDIDPKLVERNLVSVDPVYLDRFCVTNEEYQRFVNAGGYEKLEYWQEEALPALLDFVDQTGVPGPRFWFDGQFPNEEARLPVVGISWYEASAYARWVGKRLPSDAEWTKAGAWPVESAPGRIAQRRYPWGESYDVRRAHLFGSGNVGPVNVDQYPGGTSVGGIHQLIGNVWEWTATPLGQLCDSTLHLSEAVMSIRGGAFDTYFENQATCHFQSGDHCLVRRRNIGFRLALPMKELETHVEAPSQSQKQHQQPSSSLEQVAEAATALEPELATIAT